MTTDQNTPKDDPLRRERRRVAILLRSYGGLLEDLIEAVETGEAPVVAALAKRLPELRYWLKQANELEQETKDDTDAAAATPRALNTDLGQVRTDIGCRLARLRDCCTADPVSG